MEAVRGRGTENLADLLAGWSEGDLRTLGAMFDKYNRAIAAKYLTGSTDGADRPAAIVARGQMERRRLAGLVTRPVRMDRHGGELTHRWHANLGIRGIHPAIVYEHGGKSDVG